MTAKHAKQTAPGAAAVADREAAALRAPQEISFELNGDVVTVAVRPHQRLLDVLRGPLGLTGTKEGCGEGECGACTVLLDGQAVNSCLVPAPEAAGTRIVTIEGLAEPRRGLSALQQAFVDAGAIQCGFCTAGMILSARALLDARPDPTDDEIREALLGNLCRCTGYVQILQAVHLAAAREAGAHASTPVTGDAPPAADAPDGARRGEGNQGGQG